MITGTVTLEAFPSLPLIVTENDVLPGALRLTVIFRVEDPPFEPTELELRLALTPRGKWPVTRVRLTGLFVVPLATSLAMIEAELFDPLFTVMLEGAAPSAK
jgi:hypothetical protein